MKAGFFLFFLWLNRFLSCFRAYIHGAIAFQERFFFVNSVNIVVFVLFFVLHFLMRCLLRMLIDASDVAFVAEGNLERN